MSSRRPLISPAEALELVIGAAATLPATGHAIADACGCLLAEGVVTDEDFPPFPRAMMDGFAVRMADAGKTVPVVAAIAAGTRGACPLANGQCAAIMTGAPCPADAEAVVPKEQTTLAAGGVALPSQIARGQFIAARGSDCARGEHLLSAGTLVTPLVIAALAALGRTQVRAVPRPQVAIIATGGELAPASTGLQAGQVRDSNSPMLAAMAVTLGLHAPRQLHARDTGLELQQALDLCADADIVVLSGGVSVGTYDLVPDVLERIGAATLFHGVAQKPGKPLLFAQRGRQLFFGLPGNPLASHLGFHRYVSAAVRKLSGLDPRPPSFAARLTASLSAPGNRTLFLPAHAEQGADAAAERPATPLVMESSADIFHTAVANCYLEVPPSDLPLAAGETLQATWLEGSTWGIK